MSPNVPRLTCSLPALVVASLLCAQDASAQMVTTGTTFSSIGENYWEYTGVNWSVRGPRGFFARFGSPGQGIPPFGGFQPSAGFSSGMSVQHGPWSGRINFFAGQGIRRSHVTVSPFVTGLAGYPSSIFIGRVRPFVVGYVPLGAYYSLPVADLGAANTVAGRMRRGEFVMRDGQVIPAGSEPRQRLRSSEERRPRSKQPTQVDLARAAFQQLQRRKR